MNTSSKLSRASLFLAALLLTHWASPGPAAAAEAGGGSAALAQGRKAGKRAPGRRLGARRGKKVRRMRRAAQGCGTLKEASGATRVVGTGSPSVQLACVVRVRIRVSSTSPVRPRVARWGLRGPWFRVRPPTECGAAAAPALCFRPGPEVVDGDR